MSMSLKHDNNYNLFFEKKNTFTSLTSAFFALDTCKNSCGYLTLHV